jgi:hypothetical protein
MDHPITSYATWITGIFTTSFLSLTWTTDKHYSCTWHVLQRTKIATHLYEASSMQWHGVWDDMDRQHWGMGTNCNLYLISGWAGRVIGVQTSKLHRSKNIVYNRISMTWISRSRDRLSSSDYEPDRTSFWFPNASFLPRLGSKDADQVWFWALAGVDLMPVVWGGVTWRCENAVSPFRAERKNACWNGALKMKRELPCSWELLNNVPHLTMSDGEARITSIYYYNATAAWESIKGVQHNVYTLL